MPIKQSTFAGHLPAFVAATAVAVLLAVPVTAAHAQSDEGVVRISDGVRQVSLGDSASPACDGQAPCASNAGCQTCTANQSCCGQCSQCCQCDCPAYIHEGRPCHLTGNPIIDWCTVNKMKIHSAIMSRYYNCKARRKMDDCDDDCRRGGCNGGDCDKDGCSYCGLPYPNGCGGKGCAIIDHYSMVYATMPEYSDPRDGRVYSAEGFNVPVAVPLAPNVEYQYNYGWGIPSSRLTPVSRFIPEGHMIYQQR